MSHGPREQYSCFLPRADLQSEEYGAALNEALRGRGRVQAQWQKGPIQNQQNSRYDWVARSLFFLPPTQRHNGKRDLRPDGELGEHSGVDRARNVWEKGHRREIFLGFDEIPPYALKRLYTTE